MTIAESDWKTFKRLRKVALDRFCRRVLEQCQTICCDESKTPHERYGDLYGYLQEQNEDMAIAFDDVRRLTATLRLRLMYSYGLLTEEEIDQFSPEVQRETRLRFVD